jgi:small conductance mechanosensitive channel
MNFQEITKVAIRLLTTVRLKVVSEILLLFISLGLIEFSLSLLRRAFRSQQIEQTVINYLLNIISVTLRIILIVAILGFFGIETT